MIDFFSPCRRKKRKRTKKPVVKPQPRVASSVCVNLTQVASEASLKVAETECCVALLGPEDAAELKSLQAALDKARAQTATPSETGRILSSMLHTGSPTFGMLALQWWPLRRQWSGSRPSRRKDCRGWKTVAGQKKQTFGTTKKNGIRVKKNDIGVCVGVWWCAEVNEDEGALSTGLPHTRMSRRLGPGAQSTCGCCCSAVFASPFLQLCAPASVAWPSPCSLSLGSGLGSQRVLLGECDHSDVPQGWSSSVVRVHDLDVLLLGRPDNQRIEIIADGLPLFHGAQLVVDTTMVSALRADGNPHRQSDVVDAGSTTQRADLPRTDR